MTAPWDSAPHPTSARLTVMGWIKVVVRGTLIISIIALGLVLLLAMRLFEAPLCGLRRPVTPWITQTVCRMSLLVMGLSYRPRGKPSSQSGVVVANHSSWLDIFALNAGQRIFFVAKSEVAGWPGIGWLARATGTVFVERRRGAAAEQVADFKRRVRAGQQLLFFPEGTSTDGFDVLDFKPTLFAAFVSDEFEDLTIQPVSVIFHAPGKSDKRFYGWWGDMELAPHLISTLGAPRGGSVDVIYHDPVRVRDFEDRKTLAQVLHRRVRDGVLSRR